MGRSTPTGSGGIRCYRSSGFTYIGVLLAIAVLSVGVTAVVEVWTTTGRRQQLIQLNWVGAQYVNGVRGFYESTPGSIKIYPKNVEELLEDTRGLLIRRHLRSEYRNPFGFPVEPLHDREGRMRGIRTMARRADGVVMGLQYFYDPNCQQPNPIDNQGVGAGHCSTTTFSLGKR